MFLDPLMAIDWEVKENDPRWRLSPANRMIVDITKDFNSRCRLLAHRDLCDWEVLNIRQAAVNEEINVSRKISAKELKQETSLTGYDDTVFNVVEFPNWMWRVTNSHSVTTRMNWIIENSDSLHIQFMHVPYNIFKRYWRRPVRLDSKWHEGRRTSSSKHCFDVLRFDEISLSNNRIIYADFSYRSKSSTFSNSKIIPWMRQYTPKLKILTDEDSPFVKDDHEFLFITEWLY